MLRSLVAAFAGALALAVALASMAPVTARGVALDDASFLPAGDTGAVARPAACRQSTRRYRYRIRVDGSLTHTVTYQRTDVDQYGSSGSWSFRETYTTKLPRATLRLLLLRGGCGERVGIVQLRVPRSDPWLVGGTTLRFWYQSDVRPLYPQGDPAAQQPAPPSCAYSLEPSILATQVGGTYTLGSWTGSGQQKFTFSSIIEPSAEAILSTWIYDTHVQRCDGYHHGFNPSTVDLESALVDGIRFHPPTGAGNATVLVEMNRRLRRRLAPPINRLAVGRSFTLDSGMQRVAAERSAEQRDASTWQTTVRFTRLGR